MKLSLLGKLLAFTGTGGSSCFLFGSPLDSEKNRDVLLTVEYKTENNKEPTKGKRFLQDMPLNEKICVTNKDVVGNGYELMLQTGRVKGSNSKNYSIKGAWGVYKHSSTGREVVKDTDLDKFGLIVLEFEKSIHFLLVAETEESTGISSGGERKPLNVQETGKTFTGAKKKNADVAGKRFSVSRDIVGFWLKQGESGGCQRQKVKAQQQLFQNYGNLVVDGQSWSSFKVLDWAIWGETNVEKYLGKANYSRVKKTVKEGKSWFWTKQPPKNALIMKLSEATIDTEGIKDGADNQIRWNPFIKPTIITTLER